MMRNIALALALLALIPLAGCNSLQTSLKAQGIINAVLTVAATEEPVIPAQDQAAFTNFVNLGKNLDAQLLSCIDGVSGVMGKSAKFGACFNTFASALLSPAELAQLRILSPAAQAKVQLYVTAVVAGVNIVVAFTTPQVAAAPASTADLRGLGHRIGLNDASLARAGL